MNRSISVLPEARSRSAMSSRPARTVTSRRDRRGTPRRRRPTFRPPAHHGRAAAAGSGGRDDRRPRRWADPGRDWRRRRARRGLPRPAPPRGGVDPMPPRVAGVQPRRPAALVVGGHCRRGVSGEHLSYRLGVAEHGGGVEPGPARETQLAGDDELRGGEADRALRRRGGWRANRSNAAVSPRRAASRSSLARRCSWSRSGCSGSESDMASPSSARGPLLRPGKRPQP